MSQFVNHPLRIQRSRAAGWRKPDGVVCVTRPGVFGNPFRTAAMFERWIVDGVADPMDLIPGQIEIGGAISDVLQFKRSAIHRRLHELRGKTLMCWCSLEHACHADVLCRLANDG